jgi:hypothetical protein
MLTFNLAGFCIIAACFVRDRRKTIQAVRRGLKMLWRILPHMSIVLVLISICLAILTPNQLKMWLSVDSPAHFGLALVVGSIALIPGFIAFPLAAALSKKGCAARYVFIYLGAFSVMKLPMLSFEISFLGWRFSLIRLALTLPVFVIIGLVMGRSKTCVAEP